MQFLCGEINYSNFDAVILFVRFSALHTMTLSGQILPFKRGLKFILLLVTVFIIADNVKAQTQFNVDSWRGHVYDNSNFTSYLGAYNQSEVFNQSFGSTDDRNRRWFGSLRFVHSTFSVRYRMQSTKTGCYVATLAADDGIRLYVDGAEVFDEWIDQGTTSYTNVMMNLSGSSQLVYEYYENRGGNTVRFQSFTKLNQITSNGNQTICSGDRPAKINASDKLQQSQRNGSKYDQGRATSYLWQYSVDGGAWQTVPGNSTGRNYRPPVLTNNTSVDVVYRYRRVATYTQRLPKTSEKVYVDNTAVATIVVQGSIAAAGSISGPAVVDQGDIGVVYSVSAIPGATSYSWTFPSGVMIVAGNNTNSVTVNITNTATSGNISVSGRNSCGNGPSSSLALTVNGPNTNPIRVDRQAPENGYNANDLVQNVLVTGCLVANNVQFRGDGNLGIGYFNAGASDFPLSSGIIMSTGEVRRAEGPNNSNGVSNSISGATVDADVARLTGSARDVQILEFDFVPAGDRLEFRYIFASEEYPEYVGGSYNDVFGFILSGPGITGPFQNNGQNIALIPGTNNNVSINNVNASSNSAYYVDGTDGHDTEFDGRTTVLTASAIVQPCQTYHIRLIIADVADRSYNSAVFLEAESFKSNEVVIQNGIGVEEDVDVMYEGCTGSYIKFKREEDIDVDLTFNLNVAGTAENGVDYIYVDQLGNKIGDGKIPGTVHLAPGVTELTYYYQAVSDTDIEGDETLRLSFLKSCPCSAPEFYEKEVTIVDIPEIEASPTSLVSCLGASPVATITVDLKSGLDPSDYQYSLDGSPFQDDNVFTLNNPVVGSSHSVQVQDRFACRNATFNIVIPSITPIESNAGPDKTMCEGESVQLEGSGGIYYEWTCSPASGINYLSDANVPNPTVASNIPFGSYTYTLTVKESSSSSASCVDTDDMILVVKENAHFTIATDQAEYCSGETIVLTSNISNTSAGDTYSWTPASDVSNPNDPNTNATITTTSLLAKDFSLRVTKVNGCSDIQHVSGIRVHPEPTVNLDVATSNLCADGNNGLIKIEASGGTPNSSDPKYSYSWSHNGSLDSDTANNLSHGTYTITVTDSKNCTANFSIDVRQDPKPIGVFY